MGLVPFAIGAMLAGGWDGDEGPANIGVNKKTPRYGPGRFRY